MSAVDHPSAWLGTAAVRKQDHEGRRKYLALLMLRENPKRAAEITDGEPSCKKKLKVDDTGAQGESSLPPSLDQSSGSAPRPPSRSRSAELLDAVPSPDLELFSVMPSPDRSLILKLFRQTDRSPTPEPVLEEIEQSALNLNLPCILESNLNTEQSNQPVPWSNWKKRMEEILNDLIEIGELYPTTDEPKPPSAI